MQIEMRVKSPPPSPISITSPLLEEEEIQTINSTPQANKTVTPPPPEKNKPQTPT